MKRLLLRALVAAVALSPAAAFGQTVGTLVGHVFDQSGTPIHGVKIVVTSPTQIGGAKVVTTDEQGVFRLAGLTPGTFTIVASAAKLASAQTTAKVSAATTTEIDLVMEVESATEEVRIIQKAPPVNTTSAGVTDSFDADFVNALPLGSRDFQGVAALAAGVLDDGSGNPAIRGGASFNNSYTVDGFQTTDPVTHTFTENFTFSAMNQVQVRTAAFGAEHSDTLGGGINIVTKSGSNRFEGDATMTYEDQHMRLFTDARDVGTNRLMVGDLSLGGPIVKDRLWFFVSAQGVSNVSTLFQDPDPTIPRHPSRSILGFTGTAKLTWQLGTRNKIDFSTRYEPGDFNNVLQSPLVEPEAEARQYQVTRFFGAEWQSTLTDHLILSMRAGLNDNEINSEPESCKWNPAGCANIPGIVDIGASGFLRQNYTSISRNMRQSVELSGNLEWFTDTRRFGSHDIKLGGRFQAIRSQEASTTTGDAVYTVAGNDKISFSETCSNDPKSDGGNCHHNYLFSDLSGAQTLIYLSEAWQPTRYLRLIPEVAMHVASSRNDKDTIVTDALAFTPHFQAIWDPTHDGRTALRASFNGNVDTGFLELAQFSSRALFSKRCDWDAQAMAYVRNCRSEGGDTGYTVGLPCSPDGTRPDGSRCDSKLRLPRVWEYTLGAEREIVTGITLKVDYIYKQFVHQWEDIETNAIWNAGGTGQDRTGMWKTGRAQYVFDLETPDQARRQYHSLTFGALKREGRLKMQLSYTWTKDVGTDESSYASSFLDNPGQARFYYGALPNDHRHDVRALATYEATPWLSVGVIYTFLSGGPYNRYFYDPSYQSFNAFKAQRGYDPRGNLNPDDDAPLRLPDLSVLDVQARVSLLRWVHQPLDIFCDVRNLLGLRTTTSVFEQDGQFWGRPTARLPPTRARLGIEYKYR
jgi:hypothetical protein